jgi:hypothetical protein
MIMSSLTGSMAAFLLMIMSRRCAPGHASRPLGGLVDLAAPNTGARAARNAGDVVLDLEDAVGDVLRDVRGSPGGPTAAPLVGPDEIVPNPR